MDNTEIKEELYFYNKYCKLGDFLELTDGQKALLDSNIKIAFFEGQLDGLNSVKRILTK